MVDDRARKIEESVDVLNNKYHSLETELRTESENRFFEFSILKT